MEIHCLRYGDEIVGNLFLPCQSFVDLYSSVYSRMSPGWQSRALQIASNVLKRIAFALPVFRMERLDNVKSTLSESSFRDIFRFAIITSRFTIIGITYTVNSFSSWISIPLLKICAITKKVTPINSHTSAPPKRKYCISGISTPCLTNHSVYLTPQ